MLNFTKCYIFMEIYFGKRGCEIYFSFYGILCFIWALVLLCGCDWSSKMLLSLCATVALIHNYYKWHSVNKVVTVC